MGLTSLSLILGVAMVCCATGSRFEPSVAFVCDRGAMHMHENGTWASDPKTDCMEGKKEILDYCKKVYPALDITNIVEDSEHKHIKGWCALGKSNCGTTEAFKVRPFRCLTGPFQSDALIVPQDCKFNHVHQPKQCHGFSWWSEVAHKACRGIQHMKTQSFAMLLPCGTDLFTGVEYVCCPDGTQPTNKTADLTKLISKPDEQAKVQKNLQELNKKLLSKADMTSSDEVSMKVVSAPEPKVSVVSVSNPKVSVVSATNPKLALADVKLVENYLHMKPAAYQENEHDAFELAKKELARDGHDKITKLMKDWAEARKRVLGLKEIDPKGAEKMNKEITPRFQKEYFALQASSDSRLLQLDSVHQQHVQSNLDVKKRKSVEKLMTELQQDQPEPAMITKMLKRYISIEEKDAQHCIHHYTKIRDRDAAQGRQLLPTTLTHLTLISARINQSLGLLDTLDSESMRVKIVTEVNTWRSKSFNSLNAYINTFKKELHDHPATKPPRTTVAPKVQANKTDVIVPVIKVDIKSAPEPTKKSMGMYKHYADKFVEAGGLVKKPVKPVDFIDEEDVKEHEHSSHKKMLAPEVQVNHLAKGLSLAVNSNSFSAMSVSSVTLSTGASFAIAIGVLAAVVVLVLAVALVKRKVQGSNSKESYAEVSVEDNMSAEDKHIASMQNGYENPTYKYLEKQSI